MRKFVAAWVHIKPSQEHVYKFNRNLPYTGIGDLICTGTLFGRTDEQVGSVGTETLVN